MHMFVRNMHANYRRVREDVDVLLEWVKGFTTTFDPDSECCDGGSWNVENIDHMHRFRGVLIKAVVEMDCGFDEEGVITAILDGSPAKRSSEFDAAPEAVEYARKMRPRKMVAVELAAPDATRFLVLDNESYEMLDKYHKDDVAVTTLWHHDWSD